MSATVTQIRTVKAPSSKARALKSTQIKVQEQEITSPDTSDIPLPPLSKKPTEILQIDQGTPDSHVPRDPRLIRLTGVHPFNVEAPLTPLFQEGTHHPLVQEYSILYFYRLLNIARAILRSKPWTSATCQRRGYSQLGNQY
jgi:hypothetical protein